MLYAVDTGRHDAERIIHDFWIEFPGEAEGRPYADALVRGICEQLADLDVALKQSVTNWRLERLTPVDRNILRVGAFELLHRADVPLEVIIDEAVELAKTYGTENSSSFVNGVLDHFANHRRGG